jgi:hypothetical protein
MACRRCSQCGINYPTNEQECPVCEGATDWLSNDDPDVDWQLAVRLREAQTPSNTDAEMFRYRKTRLMALGFDGVLLELLVESPADIHEAERLVKSGCPLDTAAHILL